MKTDAKSTIETGKAILGIEFGSTRIKAVLIDPENHPIAQGSHTWENQLVDGLWTYSIEEIWYGLQDCYADLRANVKKQYDTEIETLAAIGVSAMMHGYMAFDKNEEILVPFRTWRNTNTGQAAAALSELFVYNIPLRWSISHLYQAILNNEKHVNEIDFLTTLAGYVHWQLTGEKVLGIGDASGMLPIDPATKNYSAEMVAKFDKLVAPKGYSWKLEDILPKVLNAGENAGCLTPEGVKRLDVSGNLKAGIPLCPPEGDAGTGMVATNAVKQRTGNVSAGTSSFSMIVLEKELSKPYEMIDMVTTSPWYTVTTVLPTSTHGSTFSRSSKNFRASPSIWTTYTASFTTTHLQVMRIAEDSYHTIISPENPSLDLPKADLCSCVQPMTNSIWPTS